MTFALNTITVRGQSFLVSELTAKQMSDVRKVMKDSPHDLDILVCTLGCSSPKFTRAELSEMPNIIAKRCSAEIMRLSDEDPDAPKVEPPADA